MYLSVKFDSLLKTIPIHFCTFIQNSIMRFFAFMPLLLMSITGHAQFKETDFHCHRDSIISETSFGSVYITKDHTCKLYDWLCPDPKEWMNDYEITENFSHLKYVNREQKSLGKFPRYWNSLHAYNGNFYVYGPSDWMSNRPDFISDSFLLEIASDFNYYSIKKLAHIGNNELLMTIDLFGEEAQLRIRLLRFPIGAALWEYTIKNESWNELKVSSDFVRCYDLIHSDCVQQKCFQEFKFDEIDLQKLIFKD